LREFISMVVRGIVQEADLPPVTAAPFADQQMKRQADSFRGRQRLVKGVALDSGNLPAGGRKRAKPSSQGCLCLFQKFHVPRRGNDAAS